MLKAKSFGTTSKNTAAKMMKITDKLGIVYHLSVTQSHNLKYKTHKEYD